MIKINEIFHSIQGESTYAGLPTVFIRTSGCHLRCDYCDTQYAYQEGSNFSVSDLLQYSPKKLLEVRNFGQKSADEVLFALKTKLGITFN